MKKLFGTDGIRGVANAYPMDPETVLKVGKSISHVFSKKLGRKAKVVIGKDTRLSGYMIENALTSGIVSIGCDVLLVGPIPTPGIAHLTKSLNCDVGVMITASHNPSQDNGIKIFASDGYKLPDEVEKEIESCIFSEEYENDDIRGGKIGKAFRIEDAKGRYIEYAKSVVDNFSFEGLKVAVDCANGAMYSVAPTILSELGPDINVINNNPDGLNINQDCGALHAQEVGAKTKESGADLGIAFDGDGDRIIVCDEKGNVVDGDAILCLFALDLIEKNKLSKKTLVVTGYSNLAVDEIIGEKGGDVVRTAAGDRYVLEEMRKSGYNLGGENSGHIIFSDHCTTGDALVVGLKLLKLMKERKKKLSELVSFFKPYPQILTSIKVKEKKPLEKLSSVMHAIEEVNSKLGKTGRTLVRYSGTEPICRVLVEAKDKSRLQEFADEIKEAIRKETG